MRYLLATLSLSLILTIMLGGLTGCEGSGSPATLLADKNAPTHLPTTVDGIAHWHNSRVEDIVQRFHAGEWEGLPDIEALLKEWGCLDFVDLESVRQNWHTHGRIFERGFRPEDLESLLSRGLDRAAADPAVSPRFHAQLELCLGVLLDDDRSRLPSRVHQLAAMARANGTLREKELAGVLLGSMQRAASGHRLPPDSPFYPVVLGYDEAGTLFGGPAVGTLYSAQVELMIFILTFPGPWW